MQTPKARPFSYHQIFTLAILALVLFTIVLDFMVISALSAILLPQLEITTKQFGLLVSAYPISAGISAILLSGYADKFDRKRLLLIFYSGFLIGVLFCANAPSFSSLIIARIITGIFGGVIGSICFAIVTDLFDATQRGRAMGSVQMAFAGSQIFGLPLALYLATQIDWQLSFWLIFAIGIIGLTLTFLKIQPINDHLDATQKVNPLRHSIKTISNLEYVIVYLNNALLVSGDIILMTFSSAFCINNLGVGEEDLPLLYGVAGFATLISAPLFGRLTDAFGKFKVFSISTIIAISVVAIYTNLDIVPFWVVIIVHTLIFLGISARMISSLALATVIPHVKERGAFMAVDASLQQTIGGIAAAIAGWIVYQSSDGIINNFPNLGIVVCIIMLLTIGLMFIIKSVAEKKNNSVL